MFGLISKKKIRKILDFPFEEQEYFTQPHNMRAREYWMREWYKKCEKIYKCVKPKRQTKKEQQRLNKRLEQIGHIKAIGKALGGVRPSLIRLDELQPPPSREQKRININWEE